MGRVLAFASAAVSFSSLIGPPILGVLFSIEEYIPFILSAGNSCLAILCLLAVQFYRKFDSVKSKNTKGLLLSLLLEDEPLLMFGNIEEHPLLSDDTKKDNLCQNKSQSLNQSQIEEESLQFFDDIEAGHILISDDPKNDNPDPGKSHSPPEFHKSLSCKVEMF